MSIFESTPLFTPAADQPTAASHWKQEKRDLNIDFDYLKKLFSLSSPKREDEDMGFLKDMQHGEHFDPSGKKSSPAPSNATPLITLHSSRFMAVFCGTEFKDLITTGNSYEDAFSREWWLDFQNPFEGELRHVCTAFNVHPLTIEDIWNQETSDKIEQYPAYRFVCFQSFHEVQEGHEIKFKPFAVFMVTSSHGTLSFCFEQNKHCENIEKRIALQDGKALHSPWVFYCFVDEIVDSFEPAITRIGKAVSQIEDLVYITCNADAKAYLAHIEASRKQVLSLIRLLAGKSQVLRGFKSHYLVATKSDINVILYINDTQDHVITMLETLNQFEGLLFRAKSNFISQFHGRSYRRRSKIFKLLCQTAILNGLFTVGMCVAQVFGMNVSRRAKFFNEDSAVPWIAIVGTYVLLVVICYRVAMRYLWTW